LRLLVATHNRGKKAEYAEILDGLGLELVSLTDLGITEDVEETGITFAENALLKARAYASLAGMLTLADDSGLEVDALGGEPGVRSARYAGPGATDEDRYRLLLDKLEAVPAGRRGARFRCVIALVWPDGGERVTEGVCEGWITREPTGTHGFGYDPVFYVPGEGRTMAELPPEVKNRISHRAQAGWEAKRILHALVASGEGSSTTG
jgi:XTP/dITP diphosphohydrolase